MFKYEGQVRPNKDLYMALFYYECRQRGIKIVLKYRYKNSILPAVILSADEEYIIAAIVAKSYSDNRKAESYGETKRGRKYNSLGIPIYVICSEANAVELANRLTEEQAKETLVEYNGASNEG